VSDAWGVLTDPLKLKDGSENILLAAKEARDAIVGLRRLQDETDSDIRFYLKDIDAKINRIENGAIHLINQTAREIRSIEQKVVDDVILIIRETECASVRTIDHAINVSFRPSLPSLLRGNTRYVQLPFGTETTYFLWFIPTGERPARLEIDLDSGLSEWETFELIENAYLNSFSQAKDSDSPTKILAAYANLAALAKKTSCFYRGQVFERTLTRKYTKYNAMVYPWNESVVIKL
jgi:hypothetical protein